MKKKFLSAILALTLCIGMSIPAQAAPHTETVNCLPIQQIWTIPNVTKVGRAVYSGTYRPDGVEEEDWDNYVPIDPSGWTGFIFNDTVGIPVYYVEGTSATLERKSTRESDGALYTGWLNKCTLKETGNFPFNLEVTVVEGRNIDELDWKQVAASGTGFAKYTPERFEDGVKIEEGVSSVTLGEGVWELGGVS